MNILNDFLTNILEFLMGYSQLLESASNDQLFGIIGWSLLLIPPILLIIFYRVWDPMGSQLLKWVLTIATILVIIYSSAAGVLYNNYEMAKFIIETSNPSTVHFFIFQVSIYSVLLSLITTIVFGFLIKRISTNNSHNPF